MKVKARSYGVDVAVYQNEIVNYANSKFAIVKVTEGTKYKNPAAKKQITSAKNNGMLAMAYFFALFGANKELAITEANHAIFTAKELGIPKGSYIAVDWETGDGNNINGGKVASANAIISAMTTIKKAGYKPLLYSGASILRNNIDTAKVVAKFGTCLWVASYTTMGRIDTPSFGYFPSMKGVAIWQFTDNWRGLHVDGNISLVELSDNDTAKKSANKTPLHVYCRYDIPRIFVVTNIDGCNVYDKADLKHTKDTYKYGTGHHVYGETHASLDVGKNKWVDGRAGYTKSNPIAFREDIGGRIIVMQDGTHALYEAKGDAKKAYAIKKGTILRFIGRKGRFFELKDKYKNKTVYVTAGIDGKRSYVVL